MSANNKLIGALSSLSAANPTTFALLAKHYADAVSRRVLEPVRDEPLSRPSLAQALELNAIAGARCWCPEVGHASGLLGRGENFRAAAAAQLALYLCAVGLEGTFEFQFSHPERLFVQERWFHCRNRTTVDSTAERIKITADGESWELFRNPFRSAPGSSSYRCARHDVFFAWGYDVDPEILEMTDLPLPATDAATARRIADECMSFMATNTPKSYAWVREAVRQISFTSSNDGTQVNSRSNSARPGNIQIAMPSDLLLFGELAVHESAHQHFNLGALLGPYIDRTSPGRLFYSALKKRPRPLDRVALAFHAVGNIYLFLNEVVDSGGDFVAAAKARMHELNPTALSLITQLEKNVDSLTENGRSLLLGLIGTTKEFLRPAEPALRAAWS